MSKSHERTLRSLLSMAALDFTCPFCAVPPERPCQTTRGWLPTQRAKGTHAGRRRLALEHAAAAAAKEIDAGDAR